MQPKRYYFYKFSNGEGHHMTPEEAFRYSTRRHIKITNGPGYNPGKKRISFNGWGWHDGLQMNFKGPKHYREHLATNGLEEWGDAHAPQYREEENNIWDDESLKRAWDLGFRFSGREAAALKSGEMPAPHMDEEASA